MTFDQSQDSCGSAGKGAAVPQISISCQNLFINSNFGLKEITDKLQHFQNLAGIPQTPAVRAYLPPDFKEILVVFLL